jgi:hypothetical protein
LLVIGRPPIKYRVPGIAIAYRVPGILGVHGIAEFTSVLSTPSGQENLT